MRLAASTVGGLELELEPVEVQLELGAFVEGGKTSVHPGGPELAAPVGAEAGLLAEEEETSLDPDTASSNA